MPQDVPLARALAHLDTLVGFPTVSARSNLDLIGYLDTVLEAKGAERQLFFNEAGTKANLLATLGPSDTEGVLLSGHTDVVPVEGQAWTSDPFRLTQRGDRVFGRGTADMKGFIACALAFAEHIDPNALKKPLHLVFSFDEEVGCIGVRRVIEQFPLLKAKPALCIVGEPTLMRPVIAHKGKVAGRILCRGHEGHSSQPFEGLNAIHLACDMVGELRTLQDEMLAGPIRDDGFTVPVTTLHVGTIQGGTALNIVPRDCTLDFEIRNIPEQDSDGLLDRLFDRARMLSDAARTRFPEAGVTIDIVNRYPGLLMPADSPAVTRVQRLAQSNEAGKISFGTEGGLFQSVLGIPTVVCGPGNIDQAHKPDEYVSLEQLAACMSFLDRLAAELVA